MSTRRKAAESREAFLASDASRLANELVRLGSSRTEALQEAERLQKRFGTGLVIGRQIEAQGEARHKITWTPPYFGVSHTNRIDDRWCTVNESLLFTVLRTNTRGHGFSSPEYLYTTAEAARAAGEAWLLSGGRVIPTNPPPMEHQRGV